MGWVWLIICAVFLFVGILTIVRGQKKIFDVIGWIFTIISAALIVINIPYLVDLPSQPEALPTSSISSTEITSSTPESKSTSSPDDGQPQQYAPSVKSTSDDDHSQQLDPFIESMPDNGNAFPRTISDTGLPFNGYIYRSYDVTSFVGYNADIRESIWDIDLAEYHNANICDVSLSFANYDVSGYTMSIQMVNYPNSGYGLVYKFENEVKLYITPGSYIIDVQKETSENQFVTEYIGYVTINSDGHYNVELSPI